MNRDILSVTNPVSGKKIASLDISTNEDIIQISKESKKYLEWSSLSLNKRCNYINIFRKNLVKNRQNIIDVLKSETEKKDFDILIELFSTLDHLKEISKIARRVLRPSRRGTGIMKNKKAYVLYEPMGTIGIISPWNYPLATPINATVEALLAGNNVVLKPSEYTPLTPLLIKKIWDECIGYSDAFKIIIGKGSQGQILVDSPNISMICFTGSTKVGREIAKKCSENFKPVILELGGKDPMIVLKDANMKRALESALFAGYSNAGQTCISVEEVFVEECVFDDFVNMISSRVESMSSGSDDKNEIGAMIMEQNAIKVKEHIAEIKESAKVVSGSTDSHLRYIPPTLIINPPDNSRVVNEETFGPVISIRKFNNDRELLDMIHKTGYGLSASIFGHNKKRIKGILSKLKIGNVSINDVFTHYGIASLPFGGEGFSGMGRMHGKEGLRALSRIKSVVENKFNKIADPWWYSRPKFIEKFLKKAIRLLYK